MEKKKNVEESVVEMTDASKIWEEIKNHPIEMFALPDQKVYDHCVPVNIEPSKLYLKTKSTSVLPALESVCGKKFTVELVDRFVVVSRISNFLTQK